MKTKHLTERLIYLDTEYISRLYEVEFKVSPETKITRTDGKQASASIAVFSGGGSSTESRTYSVSAIEMLQKLQTRLKQYPDFTDTKYEMDCPSVYCWVSGVMGVSVIKLKRQRRTITLIGKPELGENKKIEDLIGEDAFFSLESGNDKFALSPTDQYFASGVSAFKGLTRVAIDRLALPCRALIRIFSAKTAFGEWIATPLIILDKE